MNGSVRSFVCLSVCMSIFDAFFTMFPSSYHHEIFRSYYQWQKWCPCKRSRSEVKGRTQFSSFRTVIRVSIHIWQWNDAQSFMWLRKGALSFSKVICQISRSHRTKITNFNPNWMFNFTNCFEMMHKAWHDIEGVPYCFSRSSIKFQGHAGQKIVDFDLNWGLPDCNCSLDSSMALKWCTKLDVV